ncbi:peptide deformylase [Candidatus Pacearchaeota archaeon]|nr:peptide deformylase [Candidatus Pacearchaeota archaeon]
MNVKAIVTDEDFLSKKSYEIIPDGSIQEGRGLTCFMIPISQVIEEMIATAEANKGRCVGLAANQIGYLARIFIVRMDNRWIPIINPEIIAKSQEVKKGSEWCLSRPRRGSLRVRRHKWVTLRYTAPDMDGEFVERTDKIGGLAARIVQHEIDHLNGRLI